MDEARRRTGNLTCELTIVEIDETRNVPIRWIGVWRSR